jgi:phage-related holin
MKKKIPKPNDKTKIGIEKAKSISLCLFGDKKILFCIKVITIYIQLITNCIKGICIKKLPFV